MVKSAKFFMILAFVSSLLLLVACGGNQATSNNNGQNNQSENSGEGAEPTSLEIGIIGVGDMYLPILVAQEEGFFEEENLDVTVTNMGSTEIITALNSGSIPLAMPQTDAAFISFSKGASIRMIGEYIVKPPYELMAQPQYQTLADLKGTNIGVPAVNNSITIMMQRMLESAGLEEGDYNWVATGANQDRYAALKSGAISAVPLVDPMNFMAADEGYVSLGSVADHFPEASFDSWWVNTNWSDKNQDTIVRFLKAMIKAQQWVDDPQNKERSIQLLMDDLNISRDYAEKGYELCVIDPRIFVENAEPIKEAIDILIEIHEELETFQGQKAPSFEEFFDDSYLKQARQELGI